MSDITPELVEAHKRRDARIRLIDEGLAIQAEMRDSPTISYLLRRITADADGAMEELADTSPHDTETISRLLVKIKSYVYIRRGLQDIVMRAEMTAREVSEEESFSRTHGD